MYLYLKNLLLTKLDVKFMQYVRNISNEAAFYYTKKIRSTSHHRSAT